ncbi:MAG TPA: TrmO family methyltransferase [Spirochaetota bacterium]|nr:TrmO family methyltransferase [Spirochaetota bacterium]
MESARCVLCQKIVPEKQLFQIDGKYMCTACLFDGQDKLPLYPIGYIKNRQSRDSSAFGLEERQQLSHLILFKHQQRFMYKLEEERYLTIIYYLHKRRKNIPSVFRRGWDGKKAGVFASRTPERLSGLAVQDVELVEIKDNIVTVAGLDAIDGSPLLDIKVKIAPGWKICPS